VEQPTEEPSFVPRVRAARRWAVLASALALGACAGGITREQVESSQREYQLGVGLWGETNAPAAFEHLLRAIELDPDNAEAQHFLGNLFWLVRRDFQRAEHHLREALRANRVAPGPSGLEADVKNSLGVLLIHAGRQDEAIVVLRESASDLMNREPAVSWANLGWAYHEAGQDDEALQVLNQAVQLSPNLCLGWYRLGQVRVGREEFDLALQALDHALDVENPTCIRLQVAWRLRGEVHARLGHRDEAVRDLERCVELSSETDDGRVCRRLLDGSLTLEVPEN
jgi:tetratricopeptide (TPR) repeat protein